MSKQADALRRLSEAKEVVRRCQKQGRPPPKNLSLFGRPEREKRKIELLAQRCDYAEPWASYVAPYLFDAKKHT